MILKINSKKQNILELLDSLEFGMLDYMKYGNENYNETDVKLCMTIMNSYLSKISVSKSKIEGMRIVKNTVMDLNVLNQKCNGKLIETDQREQICPIIILAAYEKGYNRINEDITEEFREW